ncbi:MAG: ParA family protein [Deltaproteobacteria bacterium]|nr:ParA family protein [Deltaproteobacteria bacterium]
MSTETAVCSVCSKAFKPRMNYQSEGERFYCSLPCRAGHSASTSTKCDVCGTSFALTFAYQASRDPRDPARTRYACSETCKHKMAATTTTTAPVRPYRLAVLNQKGGVGKTTTSVNVAAGLAEAGGRVLLIDGDAQGNVGVSLGIKADKTLFHVLMEPCSIDDAVVPLGANFDVLCSDDMLAAAEIKLAQHPGRGGVLQKKLDKAGAGVGGYTHVVIDCAPSLSLINQNALCAVDEVLIPVACDYLSLVGVKQVLKTLKNVHAHLGHTVMVGGVLPTFYDSRAKICRDALEALRKHFGDLCLSPIRQNTKLKEAPSHKKTIFEHDSTSTGAEDYRAVVAYVIARAQLVARDEAKKAASSSSADPAAAASKAAS